MKKILLILITTFSISSISIAQNSRSSNKTSSDNPRAERKVAITTEAGWKTMSGTGLNISYYPISQLAIDGGLGIGWQGLKLGARARYLFLDQEFSPIIGLGFNMSPQEFGLDERQLVQIDADFDETTPPEEILVDIQLNRSYYGQIITGVEWMAQGGFVVSFNIGYRVSLNQSIDTDIEYNGESFDVIDQYTDTFINSVDRLYGGGLSTSLHLGYAF